MFKNQKGKNPYNFKARRPKMKKLKKKKEEKKLFFEYQGAELKNFYRKYVMRALIFSLVLHFVVVGAWFISSAVNDANADKTSDNTFEPKLIEVIDIPEVKTTEIIEPPVVEKQKIVPKKDLEALTPQPVAKQDAEELTTKTQDQLNEIKVPVSKDGDENGSNITDGQFVLKDKDITENIKKDDVVKVDPNKTFEPFEVQVSPKVTNLSQVQASMNYPQSAIDNGTEGRVTVKILVGKDGGVDKVGSISGPSVFHDEVRSNVRDLVFVPAMQNGQNVRCWVSVPFNFKLKSGF